MGRVWRGMRGKPITETKADEPPPEDSAEWKAALMSASRRGRLEVAVALLAAKADVNAKRDDGQTALKLASQDGHEAVASLLKKAGAKE